MMDGALQPWMAAPAARPGGPEYTLQPGLDLVADRPDGGLLVSLRPLMAMRLNGQAFTLVSAVAHGSATAEAAGRTAGLPAEEAATFLDRLTGRRLLARTPAAPACWPRVSVIIAARGRHGATRACVRSLLTLDYPGPPPEIIVVDDASEPPLAPALTGLGIRLIRLERNVGQSAARNRAAARARSELLAFIDNDCIADPGWLRALVPHLEDPHRGEPKLAIVGGRVIAPEPAGPVAAFEAVRSPLDMGPMAGAVGPGETVAYLPTCNFLVRRDVFLAARGFSPEMRLGEDVDFTWRVLRTGAGAAYAPEGRITHHHRERLGPLLRRRADYGSSEADLQHRHPAGRRVMPMPRASLLALAALTALTLAWPVASLVALALAILITVLLGREIAGKHRRLRRLGVALPASRVAGAVLREHAASLYGLSANAVRYYGLPLLALGALWPALWPAIAVLMLVAPVVDHRRLKPACGLAVFVGLYWLEMAAYQVGVWRGCLGRRTLSPLLPILHWRR